MKPIPYGRQNITQKDIDAVVDVLKSDFLTQGPTIKRFEDEFAQYIGVKYALAVANGTAALHLCALALDIQPGDKVITTPNTFVATANCIRFCGGEVVFADIDKNNYCLDIEEVRRLLRESPHGTYKGIIPVDFAGYPVNMEEFRKLADEYGLWIIEDACHAPGGYFIDSKGEKQFCGNCNYSDLSVFSFHPVKHIACGEGGMITTNNEELYNQLILLRTHGITKDPELLIENHGGWYYEMQQLGYNYRLTDIHAALGLSQLKRAGKNLLRRTAIAEKYDKAFQNIGIVTPYRTDSVYHAFHLYVIQVKNRITLYNYLREKNIFSQVLYIPIHQQPYYKNQYSFLGDLQSAEDYYSSCLSLPMYPSLEDVEQDYVINNVLNFFNE